MERLTFIRIPKNASTTLYSFFGIWNTARDELLSADNSMHRNIFAPSHRSIKQLEDCLGRDVSKKPVIAVVRNPFDRLVSMYFFARKYGLGKIYGISTDSFNNFAEGFYAHRNDEGFFHAAPQAHFIDHEHKDRFTVARFENLVCDVSGFIEKNSLVDILDIGRLGKLNCTSHEHYSKYYDTNSRSIVEDMWGLDIDMFSYSFNNN